MIYPFIYICFIFINLVIRTNNPAISDIAENYGSFISHLIFLYFKKINFCCMDISNKKKVIVTGATGAIGKAIAMNIASDPEYDVHLIARNETKAKLAKEEIIRATNNGHVNYHLVDLSDRKAIYKLADSWSYPLHVLVNNAATTPRSRLENHDGIELQFATNVLGYFWMIHAFTKYLKQAAPSRIVNVASYWAGGLEIDDLEFKSRSYHNDSAYRQSKQANRMLTVAFADKLAPFNIKVVSCHPGDVNSNLSNDLGFGGHETPDEGARTPVWLSLQPFDALESGRYYEHMNKSNCQFSRNKNSIDKLYEICASYS
jgi:NAD(P)-dependent dehydrogenase (short-subunit alcohol dehydrogenase family)